MQQTEQPVIKVFNCCPHTRLTVDEVNDVIRIRAWDIREEGLLTKRKCISVSRYLKGLKSVFLAWFKRKG
jgi:hypothetical protein